MLSSRIASNQSKKLIRNLSTKTTFITVDLESLSRGQTTKKYRGGFQAFHAQVSLKKVFLVANTVYIFSSSL